MQRLPICALILLVSAGCSSDNGATRAAPAVPATAAADDGAEPGAPDGQPAKVALTTDMARPYFAEGPLAEAAARFRLEDWRAARDGFAAHLDGDQAPGDGPDRARVLLLASIADTHLGEWRRAAEGFEQAAEHLPLLGDYIRYQAARARYFARDMDAAEAHARAVAGDSTSGADAALLVGDILRGRGQWDEVAAHYRAYLEERPRGIRLAEARFRLAEALEKQGRAVPEALDLYRRITIVDPIAAWSERAQARLDELLPALPAGERARYTELSADEYIERGMAYYGAMRNLPAESTFGAAMTARGITAETRCIAAFHRATSWFRERNRPRSAPLYDEATELCHAAGNDDLRVKAAYNAGRSYMMIGKPEIAIERYAIIEADHAEHSYADDARLRRAEAARRMGDEDLVTELLSTIPERYPDGDMRAEAMWRLAWRAIKDRKWDEAVTWLERQIEVVPLDDNYWAEGQAQYWLGRSYAALGKTAESIASYQQAVRLYPMSYYSLLALNRLRERHPKQFAALVEEIKAAPPDYDPAQPPFQFRARAVYAKPGFERALELLRLGLGNPAEAELRRLGLTAPAGKSRVDDPDEIETIWAMAYLHHLGGRHDLAHWPTRWHVLDYKRQWPVGHNRVRWEIGFPQAYRDLIARHADQHGYPTDLMQAIVREESAFNPLMESWANAIGLTQMIFPTARRFGKGTGIEITRENLRDPEKNMTIGSRFLSFLWNKWDGMVALIPPSYNAGEGATTRWLRARGTWPTDEWAEEIPHDQARRYSKRVLATYFTYTWLYSHEVPEMPNRIPRNLIPK